MLVWKLVQVSWKQRKLQLSKKLFYCKVTLAAADNLLVSLVISALNLELTSQPMVFCWELNTFTQARSQKTDRQENAIDHARLAALQFFTQHCILMHTDS
jgi:hypothetical protein